MITVLLYTSLNFGASSNDFMIGIRMKKFGRTHLKKSTSELALSTSKHPQIITYQMATRERFPEVISKSITPFDIWGI